MRLSFGTLLLLLGAALLVGGAVWFLTSGNAGFGRPESGAATSAPADPGTPLARAEHAARTASAPAGSVDLTQGPASLTGKVLIEPADSAETKDVKIVLRPSQFMKGKETAIPAEIPLGPDRRFSARGLPFGAYRAQPMAVGYSGAPIEVKLDELARHADVVLRLRRNPDLTGFVRDATRAPVEKTSVSIFGKTETGERFSFESKTASDGSFRVVGIPDGIYSVNVGPAAVPLRPPTPLTIRDGAAPNLVLDIPHLGAIDVRVAVLGVDVPVDGVFVSCVRIDLDKGGEVESLLTDGEGRVSFRNLLPGTYTIQGTREFFKRMTGRAIVEGGKSEVIRIEAIPVLDELIESLNPNPKPEDR